MESRTAIDSLRARARHRHFTSLTASKSSLNKDRWIDPMQACPAAAFDQPGSDLAQRSFRCPGLLFGCRARSRNAQIPGLCSESKHSSRIYYAVF